VAAIDSSHTILRVMDPGLPWCLLLRGLSGISFGASITFCQP